MPGPARRKRHEKRGDSKAAAPFYQPAYWKNLIPENCSRGCGRNEFGVARQITAGDHQLKGFKDFLRFSSSVRTKLRNRGTGSLLLKFLETLTQKPILIGTWTDAVWAISLYEKHGYRLVPTEEKNRLLRKYWNIPERQVDTSVVLAKTGMLTGRSPHE